jgi:hypothetical protein
MSSIIDPASASRVRAAPNHATYLWVMSVDDAHAGGRGSVLLERDGVLAELDAVIAATLDGEGRLVVLEGSAGLGKTAVLNEGRQRAHAAGLTVHAARGGQLETGFVFGVVRQLFEATLRSASSRQRADWFSGAAGLVEPLFASPTGRAPDDVDSTFAILHGLYWLAANLAFDRPTALFIDDAHWADAMSLRWLAFAARRLEGVALMIVMTTRPPMEATDPDLLKRSWGTSARQRSD